MKWFLVSALLFITKIEITDNLPKMSKPHDYNSLKQNKRYTGAITAWDEEDKNYERKSQEDNQSLLIDNFYDNFNKTDNKEFDQNLNVTKQKSRESFDIDIDLQKQESSKIENEILIQEETKWNESDIVLVDLSHENSKPLFLNLIKHYNIEQNWKRESKSRVERFKELVNQSRSKHLSSLISMNVWEYPTDNEYLSNSVIVSESFNDMSHILKPKRKPTGDQLDQASDFVEVVRQKLKIDAEQDTWLLQPKLKGAENYGIRAAVYDFIYMVTSLSFHEFSKYILNLSNFRCPISKNRN